MNIATLAAGNRTQHVCVVVLILNNALEKERERKREKSNL